ncbi:MAG: von Willebrand factor type A domain-containing protein, partial [Gammaproteobacteria bacterium]|nr:von Willebrand factor type A domain-containing protein [Gammaproteobacteria bacterium]
RNYLSNGSMPPSAAVRIEELINYFDYDYPAAKDDQAFAVATEVATAPWNEDALLLRIGLQAKQADLDTRPDANLVFLLDVSGSMHGDDRLGLIKKGVRIMLKQLTANDRVSIVVYAGASGLVLDSAAGNHYAQILSAMDQLSAGGSTHGSAGIRLAYKTAKQNFIKDGINRVILATDGDFNIGTVDHQSLIDMVKREAGDGVELTVLGVGRGNYNDATMEQLADQGNGNYAYLDNVKEANRVLGRHLLSNLFTVARDVKLQVEFNPSLVAEYRLIGYENRTLDREDFNNDKADAGEMGAGHNVTALYEIVLNDSKGRRVDPSRYQNEQAIGSSSDELAFIKVRYKPLD